MPDYKWPPMDKRRLIGKPISRLDGAEKASGRAKYSSDLNLPGMLFGALLTSPHAHARVRSIDTSEAEKTAGVKAVRVIATPGTEIRWAGAEVAAVAATKEEIARDAVRKIKVDYEVLPHVVREDKLSEVGTRAKPAGETVSGDPDAAFKEADVVSEGEYGIPVLAHCCMEPHGQVIAWDGKQMTYYPTTQGVSAIGPDLAKTLEIPATSVHVQQQHMGGGFGSKFQSDLWGAECARLSRASGGSPVKLFLDRATDLVIAGVRPSLWGKVKLAAKKDGTITAWQSETWSTGGFGGGGLNADLFPYVYREVPNRRIQHTAVSLNAASQRAWRAPMHPQVSFITAVAMEDMAASLKMDPLELFSKNANYTARAEVYRAQLKKAAELAGWSKLWHARGDSGKGPIKRGLGIGISTWGGAGHASQCRTTIHPDGSVVVELGTQDLGTGTRTVITQVAAESLGLPINAIKLNIGDNKYPPSNPSGGSTTVGGVCSSTRKSALNALEKLFAAVAPALGAPVDQLEAVDGKIQVKGNPAKNIAWKAACQKLGMQTISEMGANDPRATLGLNTGGVGGIQIADVSVDVETGVVKLNRIVIVQDCGLIVNPKTSESQCFGAATMALCGALMEERVMDRVTGRMLNTGLDFYKLAGISDIGNIIVHLDISPEHDARGIIGLGEPPVNPTIGAISNAVANAIGVRVPTVPMTPDRVLAALERRKA